VRSGIYGRDEVTVLGSIREAEKRDVSLFFYFYLFLFIFEISLDFWEIM